MSERKQADKEETPGLLDLQHDEELQDLQLQRAQIQAEIQREVAKLSPALARLEKKASELDRRAYERAVVVQRNVLSRIGHDATHGLRSTLTVAGSKGGSSQVPNPASVIAFLASIAQAQAGPTECRSIPLVGMSAGGLANDAATRVNVSRGGVGWVLSADGTSLDFTLSSNSAVLRQETVSMRWAVDTGDLTAGNYRFDSRPEPARFFLHCAVELVGSGAWGLDASAKIIYKHLLQRTGQLPVLVAAEASQLVGNPTKISGFGNPSLFEFFPVFPLPVGTILHLGGGPPNERVEFEIEVSIEGFASNGAVTVRITQALVQTNASNADQIFELCRVD